MKVSFLKSNLSAVAGLLLTLPGAYFFFINFLNEFGIHGLYNAAQPLLNSLGAYESFGWNINLLIVFGPVIAILLNMASTLRFEWITDRTFIDVHLRIQRRWPNWIIIGLGGICIMTLFIYLAGENCR
ncbi:MAG TPA: hypothetical protein VD993_20010 [Chitinophagaceae bacterium]|nr:hypothetical protein [Chitinophagaceae bacterium]